MDAKKYKLLSLAVLAMFLLLLPSGCIGGGSDGGNTDLLGGKREMKDFVKLSFAHNGMSSYDNYNLELEVIDGKKLVRVVGIGAEPYEKEADARIYDALKALMLDSDVPNWDGFNKVDNNVLDGSGFSLTVTFADGTKLNAHGSNDFPKGYSLFHRGINKIFAPYRRVQFEKNGIKEYNNEVLPLELVSIDSYSETDDEKLLRTRRIYLTPEGEEKFPALNEKLRAINEEMLGERNDRNNILVAVRADENVLSLLRYSYLPDEPKEKAQIKTYNFYPKSGEDISLGELIRDKSDFSRMNRNELRAYYGEKTLFDYETIHERLTADFDNLIYAVAQDGFVLWFPPGKYAPADKGYLEIFRQYKYLNTYGDHTRAPESYATGLVHAMSIFYPDERDFVKRIDLVVPTATATNDLYSVHTADGQNYLVEYFYDEGVYQEGRTLRSRRYDYVDERLTPRDDEREEETHELDKDDYSNLIFDDSDVRYVLTDPFQNVSPSEYKVTTISLDEFKKETRFYIMPELLPNLRLRKIGRSPLTYSLLFDSEVGEVELRMARGDAKTKLFDGEKDFAKEVNRIGEYPEYLAQFNEGEDGRISWLEGRYYLSAEIKRDASEANLDKIRREIKSSWELNE